VVVGAGQFVAALVFIVVTALVLTVLPRATLAVGWTLVGLATVVGLFGPLYRLPDWIVHLAPIAAAPTVTGSGTDVQGLWWLVAAVLIGGAASLALMRRRELAGDG
jgi:ABC-2 type transport system permease protein